MHGKQILATLSGLAALSFVMSAYADNMSLPNGWYLEGYLGSSSVSGKSYPGSASTSGVGGGGDFGYKFMPFLAVEAGYTRYATTTIKNNADTNVATDKHYSYDIAARGILPIYCTGAEIFGKLGVGRVVSNVNVTDEAGANALGIGSSNHSTTNVYVGAGAQYYLIPELALVVQWARAQGNSQTGNLDLFSGGVSFIFG